MQGLWKPNLPHFPHLHGKMVVQTPLYVPIESEFAWGPPKGMADDRCIINYII